MQQLQHKLKNRFVGMVAPVDVDRELAWRAYVLNTVLIVLIFFTVICFLFILVSWFYGLEDFAAVVVAVLVFSFLTITYMVSRRKSVTVAIYMFSGITISMSFLLSLGWGVTDISTNAFYVMAIVENSMLVRGRYVIITLGSLVAGYFFLGLAQLNGLYTPPFYTDILTNYVLVTLILIFLTFLGYVTAQLIDRVLVAQVQEAARRQQLESRAKIAAEVQLKMLPAQSPTRPDFDITGQSIPAREVGGDFYNYHQLANGTLAVIIGDVTGKGMPAALLMAVITGMIDSVIPGITKPAELLTTIAGRLRRHTRDNGLNAACLAAFFYNNKLCVANAGCITPVICRESGQLEWMNVSGLPMGAYDEVIDYEQVEIELNAGDWVIFTTDGVVEAQNVSGIILGFDALEEIISGSPAGSAQAMRNHIISQVKNYRGAEELHDDVTVVVVRVKENVVDAA